MLPNTTYDVTFCSTFVDEFEPYEHILYVFLNLSKSVGLCTT